MKKIRELAVTLAPQSNLPFPQEEMICGCGTNCTVCTGTGSKPCSKKIDDKDIEALRTLLG